MKKICKIVSVFILIFSMFTYLPYVSQPAADTIIYSARMESLYGDVNSNSDIDATDALLVLQHSVKKITLNEFQIILANVDGNDVVDVNDALLILHRVVNKIKTFPNVGDVYEESSVPDVSDPDVSSPEVSTPDVSDPDVSDPSYNGFIPVPCEDYLAYNELNDTQKSVYSIAYEKIKVGSTETFSVGSARTVSLVDMMLGVRAVLCDHPELFWAMTNFAYSTANYGNRIVQFYGNGNHTYIYDPEDIPQMQETLEAKIDEIFASTINPSMSQSEIALALHNWIVENTTYNSAAVDDESAHRDAWSAYAALIDGTAVCEGLSKAYQLLLYRAGINCNLVTGPGHMWNYVNIDGEWYHTDVTWADRDVSGIPLYHFYNQTTDVISKSRDIDPNIKDLSVAELQKIIENHVISFNYNVPVATSVTANWFVENGLYFESDEEYSDKINEKIIELANDGKNFIQIMIKDKFFVTSDDVAVYFNKIDWNGILWNLPAEKRFSSISRYFKGYACGFLITWS